MNSDFAKRSPVTVAERPYPFPSRTRKSSSPAPKILRGQLLGKIGRRRALWHPGEFFSSHASNEPPRIGHIRARVGYPDRVNDAQLNPCPWLLDDAGSIQPDRPRRLSRCGADAARPELSHQTREGRCLVGAECEIRAAREAALGSLAATIAPQQPIGDPSLLSDGEFVPPAPRRPWARLIAVAVLAALLVVGGGPVISAISPVVQSLIGSAESETPSPSSEASASAAPTESPLPTATPTATPSATPTPTPSPTPAPTASPSPTSGSGATYVVQKGDRLYSIACSLSIGCGDWKVLADLNNIPGPDYVIKPGQVLQLP